MYVVCCIVCELLYSVCHMLAMQIPAAIWCALFHSCNALIIINGPSKKIRIESVCMTLLTSNTQNHTDSKHKRPLGINHVQAGTLIYPLHEDYPPVRAAVGSWGVGAHWRGRA